MPGKKRESEQDAGSGRVFPFLAPGIGARIRLAAERIGTRAKAAKAAGISNDMLYRYIREQSPPSFSAMTGLALSAGVSLEWLATGKGSPGGGVASPAGTYSAGPVEVDLDLLEEVAASTFKELQARDIRLEPEAQARLIRVLYRHFANKGEHPDHETVSNIIDLAAYR